MSMPSRQDPHDLHGRFDRAAHVIKGVLASHSPEASAAPRIIRVGSMFSGTDVIRFWMQGVSDKLMELGVRDFHIQWEFSCESNPHAQRFIKLMYPDAVISVDGKDLAQRGSAVTTDIGICNPFPRLTC